MTRMTDVVRALMAAAPDEEQPPPDRVADLALQIACELRNEAIVRVADRHGPEFIARRAAFKEALRTATSQDEVDGLISRWRVEADEAERRYDEDEQAELDAAARTDAMISRALGRATP